MSKFILGTTQFVSNYGIKQDGQPSLKEVEKIARLAWNSGIRSIYVYDEYGDQKIIKDVFKDFQPIIKKGVYPDWFEWNGKRGLSVYEVHEPATNIFKEWDAFQFPVNVLDHRFLKVMKLLKKDGYEIHARSVFLQGLLLMKELPAWLNQEARIQIEQFHWACKNICINGKFISLQPYEAALGWVLGLKDVDHVIVGVNSSEQLKQLLEVKPLQWDYDFSITDENVLNPRKWPQDSQEERRKTHNLATEGSNPSPATNL